MKKSLDRDVKNLLFLETGYSCKKLTIVSGFYLRDSLAAVSIKVICKQTIFFVRRILQRNYFSRSQRHY